MRAEEPIVGCGVAFVTMLHNNLSVMKICFTLAPALALADTGFPPFGAFLCRRKPEFDQMAKCFRARLHAFALCISINSRAAYASDLRIIAKFAACALCRRVQRRSPLSLPTKCRAV
jgi:hypothetical protein